MSFSRVCYREYVMLIDEIPTFTDFMLEELRGMLRGILIRKIAEVVSK
jgi:hypothetical protein